VGVNPGIRDLGGEGYPEGFWGGVRPNFKVLSGPAEVCGLGGGFLDARP